MKFISIAIFVLVFAGAVGLFVRNIRRILRNINLGKDKEINDNKPQRWRQMLLVAIGQQKMLTRPVPAFFHIVIYLGFILINIEVLEILVDGFTGNHRIFKDVLNFDGFPLYNIAIAFFEILGVSVLIACAVFLYRRNVQKLPRFTSKDLDGWPRKDANNILIAEVILMLALLIMNSADHSLQQSGFTFPISTPLHHALFNGVSEGTLHIIVLVCWWLHLVGILAYLNYLPYSKHFHIVLSFPNVWYAKLTPKGQFTNMDNVTNEVKAMLDPSFTPPPLAEGEVMKFGAKDVNDLNWKNLLDAYTCTECGRCTSECPANQTGKLLSPRRIMMATRDRMEDVGKSLDTGGPGLADGKTLLYDYITPEELWACTSCNACVQACPVNIDPLNIIVELRRSMVMEDSKMPDSLALAMTNIENNGAPWQFSPADRLNWAQED